MAPFQAALAADDAPSGINMGRSGRLEEIVVTAQKREDRLQDVPLTISAFSAASLDKMKIENTQDLGMVTPSLQIGRQLNTIQPVIRGIGSLTSTIGDESKTAIYVDGVYQSALGAGLLSINNIERIEVLKGPQGTLFGRNAVAGVIHIITRDPSHTPRMDVSLGYGNFQTMEGGFYATGGLSDNLAADIAISYDDQGGGWGKNLRTGRDGFRSHEFAARSKWLLDISDKTSALFSVEIDRAMTQQGSVLRKLPGSGPLITGYNQDLGFYDFSTILDANFNSGSLEPRATKRQWGTSLKLTHEFSFAQLVSISAYQDVSTHPRLEVTGLPIPFISLNQKITSKMATQEFQLVSLPGSSIRWIGGLYYFYNKAGYHDAILSGAAFGTNFQGTHATQKANSLAGFAQATVPIGKSTNVDVGIRFTSEKRSINGFKYSRTTMGMVADDSKRFNKLTYKLSVDHKLSDDVMVYALYSRGFKSGLYNTFTPNDPVVRPEVMDTFEGGWKTEWFDHRLRFNVAAFYNRIKDIQVSQVIAATGANRFTNAAKAMTKGVEVELTVIPASGLTITAATAYLRTKYLDFPGSLFTTPNPAGGNTITSQNVAGNKLVEAPKWTPSIRASYDVPTDVGNFSASAIYSYNSGFYWAADNRIREPSYSLLNASLEWTASNGIVGVALWGRNLTKAKYNVVAITSNTGDVGSPGAPRTYGVTLKAHFD